MAWLNEFFAREASAWLIAAVCLAVWNAVSLVVTLLDKRAAIRGERRVPERRFIFFAATLGGAGVLAGFYLARHKIRKGYLLAGVWALTVATYAVAVGLIIWLR